VEQGTVNTITIDGAKIIMVKVDLCNLLTPEGYRDALRLQILNMNDHFLKRVTFDAQLRSALEQLSK
jgi:hypothetical protein